MKKYKLAVIGANTPLLPFFKRINRSLFEIHTFAWDEGAVCKEYSDKFYPISFTQKESILDICREIGINGVTSFSLESAVPTVVYVGSHLGLNVNSDEVLGWNGHKNCMRKILSSAGLLMPKYVLFKNSKKEDISHLKFPLIIKPADGGGSRGVTLISCINELNSAVEEALKYSRIKEVVVEEYVDGKEFSVEYISYQGKHYYVSITDKTTSEAPHFVELKHHQPTSLNDEQICKVKELVESSLTVLGITNSPSHTELKFNFEGKPVIIEVGPRMGGDRITSDLVEYSTGYDFVNAACLLACGQFVKPEYSRTIPTTVLFNTPQTQYEVNKIINDAQVELLQRNLSELNLTCNNNSERSGCIIYRGY
ncbi:ATP-grasp domain-containing protein [Bacteroides sp.]|uniref:ATP-grasp domain-containing protein n=1 Tax=Bacteroides sp. TaxID=29523 RepID=UPI0025894E15|nr:ATP-grasp domain-containing protein [Bacteroides sp.]